MPRGNFLEASKGGVGFQEGFVLILKSVAQVFQFPPNAKDGTQSDPFCALVWTGKKLDSEWNELPGDDNDFEIVVRMGQLDTVRPGQLAAKDFDNLDAEPDDLGDEVGTAGNCFYMVEGKFSQAWGKLKDSLEAKSFKKEILGRGITTDFEGMKAHFKTVEGAKYVARQGKNAGKEVTPTHLECDRIHTYPYDKKAATKGGAKTTAASAGKANGAAAAGAGAGASADDESMSAAKNVFGALSKEFQKECPADKEIDRAAFQKSLTKELMRQKINPKVQKGIMDLVKDDERLMALASELMEIGTGAFSIGDGTVTFA